VKRGRFRPDFDAFLSRLKPPVIAILLTVAASAIAGENTGVASYYADSLQGAKTASGEAYDKNAQTAAHRSLPMGTTVRVTYTKTGRSVDVRINDRGPRAKEHIIDLSGAAARQIGLAEDGTGEVIIEVVD